jgi:PilZ domain
MIEHRKYPRHTVQLEGALTIAGDQIPISIKDVSAQGIGFRLGRELLEGTELRLQIFVPEGQAESAIELTAAVRWTGGTSGQWLAGVQLSDEMPVEHRSRFEQFLSNLDPG